MLKYPNIDPIILHIYGNLAIRWYSLAYVFGFLLCYWWLKKQNNKQNIMSDENCEQFMSWIIFGVLVGARLFDCIFYNLYETIHDPLSIFRIWEGGMSFHGGAIGIVIASSVFCKKHKIPTLKVLDHCLVIVPIILFFGRIANFINGELYGNISYTSPFRMIFPTDHTLQPRHPSQLYEAFAEGLCLFCIMFLLFKKTNFIKTTGLLTGCFGVTYSVARFICEFFRRPEIENFCNLTAGQWLSVIMFLSGVILMFLVIRKQNKS